jgi:LysR family transcriptional regulator, nitrogen assimilation regulatory protein
MSVDFKKLRNFVKVVDAGSMSRAADILRTAQPALSQQIAALEAHFRQKLLIRSNHGIAPTEAGLALYRHAQILLRQLDQAEADVVRASSTLVGHVSIGLATYGATSALSLPLLREMAARYPGVVLHINDSFGHVLSELTMTGQMDMAVIYGAGPIKGVRLKPLFREELFLVTPSDAEISGPVDAALPLSALAEVRLLLPGRTHFLRRLIDGSFSRVRISPPVAAEIESISTLGAAVRDGLGATILPFSAAKAIAETHGTTITALTRPVIEAQVSLCISDHLPLSEAAAATKSVLLDIVKGLMSSGQPGIRAA